MPDDIEISFLEDSESPVGPLGNKAVGEPPFMYGIGVFFAIRDAMHQFKPEAHFPFESPLTPERVLLQLHADIPLGKRQKGTMATEKQKSVADIQTAKD